MPRKTKTKKEKDILEEKYFDGLKVFLEQLDFNYPIFILAFDQSATSTGFVGGLMDFTNPDHCQDMGDGEIVYAPELMWLGEPEKEHLFELTYNKYGAAMTPYPLGLNRVKDFEALIESAIQKYRNRLLEQKFNSFDKIWHNRCFVVESVFCSMPSNTIPLVRFQTVAVNTGLKYSFIPFEYVNSAAKRSVGAAGSKDNVTLCVNQIFNTNIPDTEKCTHVTDAVALLYHHVQILAKYYNRKN